MVYRLQLPLKQEIHDTAERNQKHTQTRSQSTKDTTQSNECTR